MVYTELTDRRENKVHIHYVAWHPCAFLSLLFVVACFSALMGRLLCMYWYLRVSESKYYALTSNSSYFIGVIFLHAKRMLTFGFFHELGALILLLILCTLNFLWLDCSVRMCLVIVVSNYVIFIKFNLSVSILGILCNQISIPAVSSCLDNNYSTVLFSKI